MLELQETWPKYRRHGLLFVSLDSIHFFKNCTVVCCFFFCCENIHHTGKMYWKCVASTFYVLNKGKYYFLARHVDFLTCYFVTRKSDRHVYSVLPYAFRQTDVLCLLKITILLVPLTLPALKKLKKGPSWEAYSHSFIKKFTTVYEIRRFICLIHKARYWPLTELNESSQQLRTLLRSIFIIFSLLLLDLPSDLSSYTQVLELKFCSLVSTHSFMLHAPSVSFSRPP